MNKTYQPFIIAKADEILDVLKDDISITEYAKEELCMILTQKFIDGKFNAEDDISTVFESEDELLMFVNKCYNQEDLMSLMEKGLVGMFEDENNKEIFFLTEEGKRYVTVMKDHTSGAWGTGGE